jgi:hypothetical protein
MYDVPFSGFLFRVPDVPFSGFLFRVLFRVAPIQCECTMSRFARPFCAPDPISQAMNESEWTSSGDPSAMLRFLIPRASERKMRLFVMACARDLLAYRPAAAEGDGWGSIARFHAAIDRVEAYVEGKGALTDSWIWIELSDVGASASAVVGVDPDTGMRLRDPLEAITDFRVNPAHWLRDIFGLLPFHAVTPLDPEVLAWNEHTISNLAQAIYEERRLPDGTLDQQRLAILADALEEAGCADSPILSHCRGPGPHVRGCWALDLVIGKK